MTDRSHSQRGRIQVTGFDPERVTERERISDWTGEIQAETETRWVRAYKRFMRNRSALIGLAIVLLMSLAAFLARPIAVWGVTIQPFALAPYDPTTILYLTEDPSVSVYDWPSTDYWMGVDGSGRDLFSRILFGGRYSISIGFVVVMLTASVGMVYGSISGYYGGWVDEIMMRIVDTIYAFPGIVLALIIVTIFGGGYWQLVAAFSLFGWNGYARIMRGEVLSVKESEYVKAAKALGARDRRVIMRHVLPNAMAEVLVVASLNIGVVVIGVAALGFLGLGMPPGTAEWGTMLDQTRETLIQGPGGRIPWHATVFPGLAIFVFVMSMNMIGDGINDALDAQETSVTAGGAQ
ncbi:ABC-type dipeptide/oligopeptide/nickel transportsystem, permease component [Halalkaliarchaeum sp. AArc-CO]|uniref:ABC transporter permease n=1 Tax=unclassified Halalkaliarchaeum TaxID=2678344 RepID=UPI00217F0118|nr:MULTISPECIES: ABC transporter permease [unclassified Halalkaliarchaeum]MDR5671598.1 ABC transporter permease [Halalkaliarchaeum sp. AArc-GB]UWG51100.1 ABC-type dipeptide/oligopeptide/nickel transportsystem, permease component [Halalkaliarchaeum sp. AArc-CO]